MIKHLTQSQLITFKDLFETYRRYSENINYKVTDVKILAHPNIDDRIFFHASLSGFKSGELFNEERYTCLLENGSQSECKTLFRTPKERSAFFKELVEVEITSEGKVAIKN